MAKPFAFLVAGMGASARIQNAGNTQSILLADTGNTTVSNSGGNVIVAGSQVVANAEIIFLNASANMSATMLTATNASRIPGDALASYAVVTPTEAPGLNASSRLDIFANASNTTIHSIMASTPNVGGRQLGVANIGVADLVFASNSGTGTAGGRIFTAGSSYTIPGGGGAVLQFDDTVAPGFWRLYGVTSA